MERSRFAGALFLLGMLVSGAPCAVWAQTPEFGPPLPVPSSLYVLNIPFLHFGTSDTARLRVGQVRFEADLEYGNTFSHTWQARAYHVGAGIENGPFTRLEAEYMHREFPSETMFFLDAEVTRAAIKASVGLPAGLSAGISIPYISWDAIRLDGTVEGFHEAIGVADSQRPGFPRGRFQIVLQSPNGPLQFDDRQPEAGLGDITANIRWGREVGHASYVSVEVAVKAPTGSPANYRGSGSADAGVLLGAVHRFGKRGRFGLHFDASLVIPGRFQNEREITISTAPFSRVLIGSDLRVGHGTFLSIWGDADQSPQHRDERGDVSRTAVEFGLGLTRVQPRFGTISLSIVENVPRFGDAADIAVGLRFRPSL